MQQLLLAVRRAYRTKGEGELATRKLVQFLTARYGSVGEGKARLGELAVIRDAYRQVRVSLYSV